MSATLSAESLSLKPNGLRSTPQLIKVVWRPQAGPQLALVDCPHAEVFFGGARGGGKTDGVLGAWALKEELYGEHFNAVMFRRTTVSSEDAIERSKQIFGPLGGKFNESKLRWRLPHGGRMAFAYLDNIDDAQEYQGRNLTDAWVEEAGQYPTPYPIDRLFGVLRSAARVPVQLILTANPGGAGQQWIAQRYQLIPFPQGPKVLTRALPDGTTHSYAVIPSRITDNRVMLESDPRYLSRLQLVGSAALVRAWLEGDWNAVEGAFFDRWSPSHHIVRPFEIPDDWLRFRSMDWGFAAPFSVGWWTVADEPRQTESGIIPRGAMIRYREWYGAEKPNVGLRLTADQVADGIRERDKGELFSYSVLDPSAFAQQGGPTIAERMLARNVTFRPADNRRVTQRGAMGGWDQMRSRMVGDEQRPMIYCFTTCRDSIRTIPVLQHDQDKPEDLDTEQEDHAADEWRYACMSRPWLKAIKPAVDERKIKPGQVKLPGPPEPSSGVRIRI